MAVQTRAAKKRQMMSNKPHSPKNPENVTPNSPTTENPETGLQVLPFPSELRLQVYQHLFKTSNLKECQGLYLASSKSKAELEHEFLKCINKELLKLNTQLIGDPATVTQKEVDDILDQTVLPTSRLFALEHVTSFKLEVTLKVEEETAEEPRSSERCCKRMMARPDPTEDDNVRLRRKLEEDLLGKVKNTLDRESRGESTLNANRIVVVVSREASSRCVNGAWWMHPRSEKKWTCKYYRGSRCYVYLRQTELIPEEPKPSTQQGKRKRPLTQRKIQWRERASERAARRAAEKRREDDPGFYDM